MSTASGPIVVLVALREELTAVRAVLEKSRPVSWGKLHALEGRVGDLEVVAARTGLGAANAAKRTAELIGAVRPSILLVTGFAGALSDGLSTGDVLIASEVVEAAESNQQLVAAGSWKPPQRLLEAAIGISEVPGRAAGSLDRVSSGRLATVSRVFKTPDEKRSLGQALEADGVDMETYAIAAEAARQSVPLLCARVILDDVHCELPFDFGKILTPSGDPRPAKVLTEVLRHPSKAKAVADLAARARKARKSLTSYLQALLARPELRGE